MKHVVVVNFPVKIDARADLQLIYSKWWNQNSAYIIEPVDAFAAIGYKLLRKEL